MSIDDEPKPNSPPGKMAWLITALSLLLPIIALVTGWIGIQDQGQTIQPVWFFGSFAIMIFGLVFGIVVHFWGLFKGFYPKPSLPWILICGLGMVGGIVTLVAGIILLCRLNGVI